MCHALRDGVFAKRAVDAMDRINCFQLAFEVSEHDDQNIGFGNSMVIYYRLSYGTLPQYFIYIYIEKHIVEYSQTFLFYLVENSLANS